MGREAMLMSSMWERMFERNSFTAKAIGLLPAYFTYKETYNFLKESQWWSREQLENYQMHQLSGLLSHAYENVPYYRRVFDERGLKPEDIQVLSDIRKLPFLTREIIQQNLKDLKAQNYQENRFEYITTGGSTGIPLGFYYEKRVSRAREWAFIRTLWDRLGYRFTDRSVILRGNVIPSADDGRFWQRSFFGRWLVLSSYHMTDDNLSGYIQKIREFKPRFIQAYPSTITILARYMKMHDVEPFPTVKAILCGSENLYPWQRDLLEEVFGCRVYSWYGNSEQVVLAGECEVNQHYHIFPEYGIVEIIGKDDKPVRGEGEMGEVVATGLNNWLCPLIRYRTMDLAIPANNTCGCGREYPLLRKVEGRTHEFIITKSGRPISLTSINMHSNVFDHVNRMQYYQEKQGDLYINIVKNQKYSDIDTRKIRDALQGKLGRDMDIIFCFVDEIPLTARGKNNYVIQKLPISWGEKQ